MASHSSATSRGKRRRFAPRLEMMEDRQLLAAAVPGVTLDPLSVPKFVNPLPNPLDPSFVYQPTGTANVSLQDGSKARVPLYSVGTFQTQEDLLGLKDANGNPKFLTKVYGYGTSAGDATYPGHSFVVESGSPIAVQWTNGLPTGEQLLRAVDPTVLDQPTHDQSGTPYYTVSTDSTGFQTVNFTYGVPMVPHVHGGHTTAASDGTPLQWFTAGGQKGPDQKGPDFVSNLFTYDNSQQAASLWYHDHAMGITRLNVYAGLAGFYIIHDKHEEGLTTPSSPSDMIHTGTALPAENFDIPLAIQDRMFTTDGQLYYPANPLPPEGPATQPMPDPSVHPEFFGDTILVNGKAWPFLDVEPRMYRFRILNGSNSRFYDLRLPGQPILQIGTDDGLLAQPVALSHLTIAPGERADVVIDFSKRAGQTIILRNDAKGPFPHGAPAFPQTTGEIMEFRVGQSKSSIPDATLTTTATLNTIRPLVLPTDAPVRQLGLFETTDQFGRLIQKLGANVGAKVPAPTNDFVAQDYLSTTMNPMTVHQGDIEEWQIFNTTADTHPIHLHQVSFQIVSRQKFTWTADPITGEFTVTGLTGQPRGPDANEAGWKDTVQMNPGEVTIIRAKFDLPGKYVWHCHILEHEEHDMMNEYMVVPATTFSSQPAAQAATSSSVVPNALALAPSVAAVSPDPNLIDPLAVEVISPTKKKKQ
jgi:spore coat protein A, manganese oxidase